MVEQAVGVAEAEPSGTPGEVLLVFLRLGLTSFGGPVAHLGYFREELVERRGWVDEATYADLVALCQFLPGPASSQVGIAMGTARAGLFGGLMAWIGFTLPSALLMAAFGVGLGLFGALADSGLLQGLKLVAVAVVAQAVWGMATKLSPDPPRATIAIVAAMALLVWPTALMQLALLALAGLIGWRSLRVAQAPPSAPLPIRVPAALALASAALLPVLLVGLPLLAETTGNRALALFEAFFRAGALVFGGGHVVLPLLEAAVVAPGWVSGEQFVAGYGVAQAVPGPLFTFAAYLGAVNTQTPNGWAGAALALAGIFAPSFLLLWAGLPLWSRLRTSAGVQAALRGVNAAVVGILLAALYDPVITSAVAGPLDVAVALGAFALLQLWRVPPWLVVALAGLVGGLLGLL